MLGMAGVPNNQKSFIRLSAFFVWRLAVLFLTPLFLGFYVPPALSAPDVEAIEKGVVRVITRKGSGTSTGTGFILNNKGYVATNNHVVRGGQSYQVAPSGAAELLPAELVWADADRDLAVLKVSRLSRPPVKLSFGPLKKGDTVHALGFPGIADRLGNATEATVTRGVVGRKFDGGWGHGGESFDIIQHSAHINPGNSGGPLFDDCGRVIGVNTQGSGAGRIVRDKEGRVRSIMAGTGVFFASAITSLKVELDRRNIQYLSVDNACLTGSQGLEDAARIARDAAAAAKKAGEDAKKEAAKAAREAVKDVEKSGIFQRVKKDVGLLINLVIGLTALTLLVLAASIRSWRQRVVGVAGQASNFIVQGSKSMAAGVSSLVSRATGRERGSMDGSSNSRGNSVDESGWALSGFDAEGRPIRLPIGRSQIEGSEKGVTIGRHPNLNHVVIKDSSISRRHCRLILSGEELFIEDLNSSNGTFADGRQLAPFNPERLSLGSDVRLGSVRLTLSQA